MLLTQGLHVFASCVLNFMTDANTYLFASFFHTHLDHAHFALHSVSKFLAEVNIITYM